MNIAIIRLSSMGDVILVSPLFSMLHKQLPGSTITFITNTVYTDFYRDDPRLYALVGVPIRSTFPNDLDSNKMDYDCVIDLQNNRKSAQLRNKFFPHIKTIRFNKLRIRRFFLLLFRFNVYDLHNTVIRRYLQTTISFTELPENLPATRLYFNEKGQKPRFFPLRIPKSKLTIALFPFCAWRNKKWPLLSYSAVGKHFATKGWSVMIFGGKEDQFEAKKLSSEIGDACIDYAGKISLYEVGLTVKECDLAVGNDTGLSHLARACNVRTGMIYGSTTVHFGFFPYGDPAFTIFQSSLWCRPCHAHGGNRCLRITRPCLSRISVQRVIGGLEELYNRK